MTLSATCPFCVCASVHDTLATTVVWGLLPRLWVYFLCVLWTVWTLYCNRRAWTLLYVWPALGFYFHVVTFAPHIHTLSVSDAVVRLARPPPPPFWPLDAWNVYAVGCGARATPGRERKRERQIRDVKSADNEWAPFFFAFTVFFCCECYYYTCFDEDQCFFFSRVDGVRVCVWPLLLLLLFSVFE